MDATTTNMFADVQLYTAPSTLSNNTMTSSYNGVMTESVQCRQDEHRLGIFEVAAATVGVLIGLTNLIVIVAISIGGQKLRKATFYCICNLAVADMLAGLLLLWVFGLQKVLLPFRTAESELVQKSFWIVTVWSSMLSQIVIAADRYCYVTKGTRGDSRVSSQQSRRWGNNKRKRAIKAGISFTWLVPVFTFVAPVAFGWNCLDNCICHRTMAEDGSSSGVFYMVCQPVDRCSQINPSFTKSSMLYLGLTLILMPIIPCILYLKIYLFVRRSSRKMRTAYSYPHIESAPHPSLAAQDDTVGKLQCSVKGDLIVSLERAKEADKRGDGKLCSTKLAECFLQCLPVDQSRNVTKNSIAEENICCHSKGRGGAEIVAENGAPRHKRPFGKKPHIESHKAGLAPAALRSSNRDMRLLRTLIIILALFLVSTIPLGVLFLVSFTEVDKRYVLGAKVLLTTSLLNSLGNPWVYFWRFPEMRVALRRVVSWRGGGGTRRVSRGVGDTSVAHHRGTAVESSRALTWDGAASGQQSQSCDGRNADLARGRVSYRSMVGEEGNCPSAAVGGSSTLGRNHAAGFKESSASSVGL